ncbi:calcium binding EGF domain protein [Dictyocaulus viviparus]|uniref:Calcium binding EGF domain protein n=1 Tax=Dictyocaulus viviparus TaxID=29172 RepID=A0A0D8XWL2_DICVI|nr:calcium binding EGF domain protein [Dictyocaulus viviparus]
MYIVEISVINECSDARLNNCSPNAKCIDKEIGYTCRCFPGFIDTSSGGATNRGRNCTKCKFLLRIANMASRLVDECSTKQHDCDPKALCRDKAIGFSCHCPFGYSDSSPDRNKPGRVCIQS